MCVIIFHSLLAATLTNLNTHRVVEDELIIFKMHREKRRGTILTLTELLA